FVSSITNCISDIEKIKNDSLSAVSVKKCMKESYYVLSKPVVTINDITATTQNFFNSIQSLYLKEVSKYSEIILKFIKSLYEFFNYLNKKNFYFENEFLQFLYKEMWNTLDAYKKEKKYDSKYLLWLSEIVQLYLQKSQIRGQYNSEPYQI